MTIRIYVRASTKDQDAERALEDLKQFANEITDTAKYQLKSKHVFIAKTL